MIQPVLHHYPASPFSEKVRAILGYKDMAYHSVRIPAVMPKPDLLALTGGYRKTPVLQLGCDIYCDTRIIARVLEALTPEPTLYPAGSDATLGWMCEWIDRTFFFSAVPFAFQPEAIGRMATAPGALTQQELENFLQDRIAFAKNRSYRPPTAQVAMTHMPVYLAQAEAQLTAGGYLLGEAPCAADFSLYHCVWFLQRGLPELIEARPALAAWVGRMAALGHGRPEPMEGRAAVELCRDAEPRPRGESLKVDGNGLELGSAVQVRATDLGPDPVEGQLVHLGEDEIALERQDERAGRCIVHFPRVGYDLAPA